MEIQTKKENKNYFRLEEFLKSSKAVKLGIQNLPSFSVISNIEMMLPLLNELRESWGDKLRISSGFRCKELNDAVGGVATSMHLKGLAVDIVPCNGDIERFIGFCQTFFKGRTDFDQVIIEKSGKSRWVHIGLLNNEGKQRCQIFNINKEDE